MLFVLAFLLERPHRNFFVENYVVLSMILHANISVVRTNAGIGFKIKLTRRNRIAFFIVRNFYSIKYNNGSVSVKCDFESIPLRSWFPCDGQWFGKCVEHTGRMIFIFT